MRFHALAPPEAASQAADPTGRQESGNSIYKWDLRSLWRIFKKGAEIQATKICL